MRHIPLVTGQHGECSKLVLELLRFTDRLILGVRVNNDDFKISERLVGKIEEKVGKVMFLIESGYHDRKKMRLKRQSGSI